MPKNSLCFEHYVYNCDVDGEIEVFAPTPKNGRIGQIIFTVLRLAR